MGANPDGALLTPPSDDWCALIVASMRDEALAFACGVASLRAPISGHPAITFRPRPQAATLAAVTVTVAATRRGERRVSEEPTQRERAWNR